MCLVNWCFLQQFSKSGVRQYVDFSHGGLADSSMLIPACEQVWHKSKVIYWDHPKCSTLHPALLHLTGCLCTIGCPLLAAVLIITNCPSSLQCIRCSGNGKFEIWQKCSHFLGYTVTDLAILLGISVKKLLSKFPSGAQDQWIWLPQKPDNTSLGYIRNGTALFEKNTKFIQKTIRWGLLPLSQTMVTLDRRANSFIIIMATLDSLVPP